MTDVTIRADHAQGRLLMTGKNLMQLGKDDYSIPAVDVQEALLEEFAKTLLGQGSGLRKYRTVLGPR